MAEALPMAQVSRAIGLARIVLIIGLVFLHYGTFPNSLATPFAGLDIHEHRFATWANSAILFFFFSAVPLLSMISGWLFFSFSPEEAKTALKKRIRRRVTSLYMPLVVWNLAYLAVLYVLFVMHPDASFLNSNRILLKFPTATAMDYVNAIFGIQHEPVGFQFWFVRDLFVSTLVSPIMWLLLSRCPRAGALVLAAIWLSGWDMFIFLRSDVPFFFYLGGFVRQRKLNLTVPLRVTLIALAVFITLACLNALAPYVTTFPGGDDPYWLGVIRRAMRIAGVIGCWGCMYRLVETRAGEMASRFGGLAFFLHSAHWPQLAVVKVVLWHFMPGDSDGWMLLHFFLSVGTTAVIGISAGLLLAYAAPRLFSLMNGGRLLSQTIAAPTPASLVPQAA